MRDSKDKDAAGSQSPAEILLTEREAALHLGITPALLYDYARHGGGAGRRRLCTTGVEGRTYFNKAELDDFDRHLRQPWVAEGERTPVPRHIVAHLRAESSNRCQRCERGGSVETAHICAWSTHRSHYHHYLLRLCSTCHAEHDRHGSVSTEELRRIKRRAIERMQAMLREGLNAAERRFHAPPPDATFVGRDEDLERLCEGLEGGRAVLVHGAGGVGKTQLLLQALKRTKLDGRLVWVDLEGFEAAEDLISALAAALEGTVAGALDRMAEELDARIACVVLDGVERLASSALDDTDDLLASLLGRTKNTRFLVTSQVNLLRTRFDHKQPLCALAPEPSRALLRSFVPDEVGLDDASEAALLVFCEGHPLTLRLTGVLVEHIGSGRGALEQIKGQGARAVKIPERRSQNRQTSLERCLSLAYDMLKPDQRRLLYVIASCPGGIMASQLKRYGGSDAPLLTAALRRWSLVQVREAGLPIERWQLLSPIRSFVARRWSEENPAQAQALTDELLRDFAIFASISAMKSADAADIPHKLWRFFQEWPNLRLVIDAAEARPEDAELSILAIGVCTSAMQFFFVTRLPERGVQLMGRGVRIAMRDARWEEVSGYVAQAASLAQRSENPRVAAEVEAMLEGVPEESDEARGNLAMARSMLAKQRGDALAAEEHARDARRHYERAREKLRASIEEDTDAMVDNGNNLSAALQLLGNALLASDKPEDAQRAYEEALSLVGGAAVAVNKGQILHQIGNCRSSLGEYGDAVSYYGRAAVQFQTVGMREYIANALSELGYAFLELDDSTPLPQALSDAVLGDGIEDAVESTVQCLSMRPVPGIEFTAQALRRLFGTLVVLSFSDETRKLGEAGNALLAWTNRTLLEIEQGKDVKSSPRFELMLLRALASIMQSVVAFEDQARTAAGVSEDEIDALWEACSSLGPLGNLESLGLQWVRMYLRRKLSVEQDGSGPEPRSE